MKIEIDLGGEGPESELVLKGDPTRVDAFVRELVGFANAKRQQFEAESGVRKVEGCKGCGS